jgi:hypothetical protein
MLPLEWRTSRHRRSCRRTSSPRWTNAGEAARGALGPDADAEQVWSAQRVIFHDRETYKD